MLLVVFFACLFDTHCTILFDARLVCTYDCIVWFVVRMNRGCLLAVSCLAFVNLRT